MVQLGEQLQRQEQGYSGEISVPGQTPQSTADHHFQTAPPHILSIVASFLDSASFMQARQTCVWWCKHMTASLQSLLIDRAASALANRAELVSLLQKAPSIRRLHIAAARLSSDALEGFLPYMPHLSRITLSSRTLCPQPDLQRICQALNTLPQLLELELFTEYAVAFLQYLPPLSKLQRLRLMPPQEGHACAHARVTVSPRHLHASDLAPLLVMRSLQSLELDLKAYSGDTHDCWSVLSQLTALTHLALHHQVSVASDARALAAMCSLQRIELHHAFLDDAAALRPLHALSMLTQLRMDLRDEWWCTPGSLIVLTALERLRSLSLAIDYGLDDDEFADDFLASDQLKSSDDEDEEADGQGKLKKPRKAGRMNTARPFAGAELYNGDSWAALLPGLSGLQFLQLQLTHGSGKGLAQALCMATQLRGVVLTLEDAPIQELLVPSVWQYAAQACGQGSHSQALARVAAGPLGSSLGSSIGHVTQQLNHQQHQADSPVRVSPCVSAPDRHGAMHGPGSPVQARGSLLLPTRPSDGGGHSAARDSHNGLIASAAAGGASISARIPAVSALSISAADNSPCTPMSVMLAIPPLTSLTLRPSAGTVLPNASLLCLSSFTTLTHLELSFTPDLTHGSSSAWLAMNGTPGMHAARNVGSQTGSGYGVDLDWQEHARGDVPPGGVLQASLQTLRKLRSLSIKVESPEETEVLQAASYAHQHALHAHAHVLPGYNPAWSLPAVINDHAVQAWLGSMQGLKNLHLAGLGWLSEQGLSALAQSTALLSLTLKLQPTMLAVSPGQLMANAVDATAACSEGSGVERDKKVQEDALMAHGSPQEAGVTNSPAGAAGAGLCALSHPPPGQAGLASSSGQDAAACSTSELGISPYIAALNSHFGSNISNQHLSGSLASCTRCPSAADALHGVGPVGSAPAAHSMGGSLTHGAWHASLVGHQMLQHVSDGGGGSGPIPSIRRVWPPGSVIVLRPRHLPPQLKALDLTNVCFSKEWASTNATAQMATAHLSTQMTTAQMAPQAAQGPTWRPSPTASERPLGTVRLFGSLPRLTKLRLVHKHLKPPAGSNSPAPTHITDWHLMHVVRSQLALRELCIQDEDVVASRLHSRGVRCLSQLTCLRKLSLSVGGRMDCNTQMALMHALGAAPEGVTPLTALASPAATATSVYAAAAPSTEAGPSTSMQRPVMQAAAAAAAAATPNRCPQGPLMGSAYAGATTAALTGECQGGFYRTQPRMGLTSLQLRMFRWSPQALALTCQLTCLTQLTVAMKQQQHGPVAHDSHVSACGDDSHSTVAAALESVALALPDCAIMLVNSTI